jgi:hypothetical protein
MKKLLCLVVFFGFVPAVLNAGDQLQPISTKDRKIPKRELTCGKYLLDFLSFDNHLHTAYIISLPGGLEGEAIVARESLKPVLDESVKVPTVETMRTGETIIRLNKKARKKARLCLPSS